MRAPPLAVAARFRKQILDLLKDFDELLLAVHNKHRQASLESMLAEQTALLMAVMWEAFVNDLFISYVLKAPASCKSNFEDRFHQGMHDKYGGVSRWVSLEFPDALTQKHVENLLDPKGWNIGAGSAQQLADLANRHLSVVNARNFSLEADDRDFVDYLTKLRNYLSHRSTSSRSDLARSVSSLKAAGSNSQLVAPIKTVSKYLKDRIVGGQTRVNLIGRRAIQISVTLTAGKNRPKPAAAP